MSDDDKKPEVKPAVSSTEEPVVEQHKEAPSGSSPEKKPALKLLGKEKTSLDPSAQEEWDNQPAVVSKDGEAAPEEKPEGTPEEPDRITAALEKEKQRVERRKAILAEITQGKAEVRALAQPVTEPEPEQPEPIEEDGWKVVDQKIEQRLSTIMEQREFFAGKPDFYAGNDGKQNQEVVLKYVQANFKNITPAALQMAHGYIFGSMEQDIAVREAKRQQTGKVIAHKAAVLGSAKGTSTAGDAVPARKRILPKSNVNPATDWYA